MTIYRKAAGSWTTIRNIYRKYGGVWTSVENVYRKAGGVWNSVFLRNNSPVIHNRVTIASNVSYIGDGETATLTGRNYSWTPVSGLTLTYRFEKSTSISFASSTLVASGNITNPASGSSNTITRSISPSDFSQTDMYFRFKVTAVNSSGTTVSVSDVVGVSYYGTPVPQSPYPEITGSTTVGNNAFGNIGVWTNSPTSYSYRWFFNSGLSSYPLTFSQSRSVTNKSLSGLTATLTTSAPHGYKASDVAIITSMDNSLFNKSSATISSVTNSTITYTITSPAAWADAGTPYTVGQYVLYSGNVYSASSTISSSSPYNGGTLYSSGAIVYSGTNRYQSNLNNNIGNSVTNPIYWNPLGNFAPGGSLWTLQNFSNVAASGTITGPNYYEGSVVSSTSILLATPTTDYKTSIDLRGAVLGFGVKAYNPATSNPSEYTGTRFIYGYPVITVGSISTTSTTASIPYTNSYMTQYVIDILFGGTSIGGVYPLTVTSPSSPISVTGLTNAPRTYSYSITPKNGEGTSGSTVTGTFTTVSAPTISGISVSDTTPFPSSATSISVSNTAPSNTGSVSWVNNANTSVAGLFTVTGAGSGGSSPTNPSSLLTSGTFTVGSTGTANVGIRSINTFTSVHATWTQSGAQSYRISYDISGVQGNPQTATGNSSVANPSAVLLQNSTSTVTLRSITVYPNINQGGTGVTLTSTASTSAASKITDTSGSGSVTYTAPSTPPTGGSVSVDPTTGTAGTTQFTATPSGWSGTTPITYSYSWQWMNSSFAWTSVATGSTFTPTVAQNSSAIAWRVVLTASNGISPNGSATANFSVNNPAVIPTITMGSNTGVTSSAGTINWSSTNQSSFSSTGTFSGTGTTGTSISKTGLTPSTNYTGTVTVTSSTGNTAAANYSLTTTAAPLNPVVWGAMTAPTFARNTTPASSSTSYRWGWNNQLPTSGDYTASNITWEWQHSSANTTTTQSASPAGLIASGTRPNRSAGGLTVGSSTFNNRVSSLSGDYNTGNPAQATVPINNEPVTFSTASRYLRYRAVVVGTDGTTYRSNYSAWV